VVLAVFDVIKEINAGDVAVLLVEQNAALALEIAARAYVLEEAASPPKAGRKRCSRSRTSAGPTWDEVLVFA